ncbi:MAG: carbohydrate-binding protein [Pontiella sp.]
MKRRFQLVMMTAGLSLSCFATDYYVSTQSEFDAIARAALQPGDAILLERGKQFVGMLAPTGTGTETELIRIDAFGDGERPQIHGMGVNQACIRLSGNPSFWEIQGLELTNTDGTDLEQGDLFGILIYMDGGEGTYRHIYIHDFYIHDVNGAVPDKGRGGIHVMFDGSIVSSNLDDLRITGNQLEDIGGVGIATDSSCANVDLLEDGGLYTENLWTRVYIASNRLDRIGRNGIIIRDSEYAVVEYNMVGNTSLYDKGHNIFCFDTLGITIQYNEAYGNTAVGTEGDRGGFDADYNCVDTLIQYNYSHDNEWFCGIMKKANRNVVIRYNVSQNEEQGFYFYGFNNYTACESVHIYNNTHYVGAGLENDVVVLGRTPLNTIFENNIFYFEEGAVAGFGAEGINTYYTNNLYYNLTPHASDPSPVIGDPQFTLPGVAGMDVDLTTMGALRGYQLLSGSPAIDAATFISGRPIFDIVGHAMDAGGADIGAFEYAGPVSRVTFDFLEGSAWDGGTGGGEIGSNVTLTNSLTGETVTLTTIDVIGQDGSFSSAGAGHTLNVLEAAGYLGVNDNSGNPGGYSAETRFFNPKEGWVFSFDVDVYLENIRLESQTFDAELTLSSELFDDVVMKDGRPDDIHDLEYRYIPAETELTLLMTTPTNGVDVGIGVAGITVSAVPLWEQLPPTLQAEAYAEAMGVSTHLCSDEGGGEMVVFGHAGDEISFNIEVPNAGSYLVGFRVASIDGMINLELEQNGNWVGGLQRIINGGGAWVTLYKLVRLDAGSSTLRILLTGGDCRLNWLSVVASGGFSRVSAPADPDNRALNQSYSASNVYQDKSSYAAGKACDGDLDTRWATDVSPAWLEVDFGETVLVNGTRVAEYGDRIRSYEIQVYNGEWKTAFVGGDPSAVQTDWFPAVAGSKVRLQTLDSTFNPSIWEFEVFTVSPKSAFVDLADGSVLLDWQNTPGVSYTVQTSTNLVNDLFTTIIESGIPSLEESNRIVIKMDAEKAAFYRIIAE